MLDAIRPESVQPHELGLKAVAGMLTLTIECAERDARVLLEVAPLEIHCQLEADDGDFHLVGFSSESRRLLYRGLRAVNGIGRRSALVVLDCGETVDVLRAVSGKDKKFFRSVPGVGPKKIEAIINTLGKRYKDALPAAIEVEVEAWVEARDGIMNYDLGPQQADQLLQRVAKQGMNAEQLLTAAQISMQSPGSTI